jgi:ABC-2 type transport system permease protein
VTAFLVAGLTVRELSRRRLVAAVGVLTVVIVGFTAWGLLRLAGATADGAPLPPVAVRATAAGIVMLLAFLFSFVLALGAALVAAPAMAESIANGEILVLLARPIRRADVVLGRWLGSLAALVAYVALAGGVELLVVRATTGYAPPHPFVALAYLAGLAAVVTTAAVALATRLPALAAGTVAALLFGLAWIGGILESIGLALGNAGLADAGTIVTLAFPSDALWRGALFALQPAVLAAASATSAEVPNPFSVTAPPPGPLLIWACGWVAVVFAAGIAAFRSRDL